MSVAETPVKPPAPARAAHAPTRAVVREVEIARAKRVFVNRNLKMEGIGLIGFDMDYTLAIYHQAELERLSIALTLQKLVEKRGYPEAIRGLEYHP